MSKAGFEKRPGIRWLMDNISNVTDDCLIWPFAKKNNGYGAFMVGLVRHRAHRYVCQLTHGDPPSPDHQAAHSCNNPSCVNPRHLSWKTPAENQQDRGPRIRRRKVNEVQVAKIRALKGSESPAETAVTYGVSEASIRNIQNGKTWNKELRVPTDEEVAAIRIATGSGIAIAERFGLSRNVVWRIRKNLTYRHVQLSSSDEDRSCP